MYGREQINNNIYACQQAKIQENAVAGVSKGGYNLLLQHRVYEK
jgi:hypothetical protein